MIARKLAILYQFLVMLPALSEPVPLAPGRAVRLEQVSQACSDPLPEPYLHFHGPAELVFMAQGSGRFISEAGTIRFAAGEVLFVPGMAVHDFAFDPGARRWTLVQFDPLAVNPDIAALPRAACSIRLEAAAAERSAHVLGWLAASIDEAAPEAHVRLLLSALLLALRPAFSGQMGEMAAPITALSHFRPLLQHWEARPDKPLSLADAASLCGLSASYFSRVFARTFGAGFVTYQTRFRLEQAARMLATSDAPVSQIGYRAGFRSPAYFSQCYRALFGVTPTAHRETLLSKRS